MFSAALFAKLIEKFVFVNKEKKTRQTDIVKCDGTSESAHFDVKNTISNECDIILNLDLRQF